MSLEGANLFLGGSRMQPPSPRYTGYKSFGYLEPGRDYKEFKLSPETGRVPPYRLGLSAAQQERASRLLVGSIAISLHDHPTVCPEDMTQALDVARTGRQRTGYEGLALRRPDLPGRDRGQTGACTHYPCRRPRGVGLGADEAGQRH